MDDQALIVERNWTVLLIGGPSGVGKTTIMRMWKHVLPVLGLR